MLCTATSRGAANLVCASLTYEGMDGQPRTQKGIPFQHDRVGHAGNGWGCVAGSPTTGHKIALVRADHLLIIVIYALACARITGLVTADTITAGARTALLNHLNDQKPSHRAAAYLTTCAWCAGLWIAAPTAALAVWHTGTDWRLTPALALAYSWFTGVTSHVGR